MQLEPEQTYSFLAHICHNKANHNNLEILEIYLKDSNYYWLGHSLGCKYISLLEILSNEPTQRNLIIQKSLGERYHEKLISLIKSVDIAREKAEQEISNLLNQAININPNFAKAYIKSGLTRYKLADYYGAIEDYTQAIRINSYDAVAFQNRGDVRSMIGDSQGAIEDYSQARKINPHLSETEKLEKQKIIFNINDNSHNSTVNENKDNLERENHQRAIEVFTQVIEISPDDAVGYKKRGNARCDLGDYLAAIEDFTKAIQINPYDGDAYFYRGNAFYELGDKPEAIEDYTQAIKINDNDADAYINRGNLRDELGDTQGAVADFQVAADLYQKAGNVQEHKDTKEKILDLEIEESLDVLDF